MAEGIFDVLAVFNETNEFVLYYHRFLVNWDLQRIIFFSGRKTIRAFRRKDGKLIANFRVQVSLPPYSLFLAFVPRLT